MRIKIIGTESLGVRGLCCVIETGDRRIVIDPGVALGYQRFGLLPHPFQVAVGERIRREIIEFIKNSTDIVISHFHGDHCPLVKANPYQLAASKVKPFFYTPRLWCKGTQGLSAAMIKRCDNLSRFMGRELPNAEGKEKGPLSFSHSMPHGEGKKSLGTVMMTRVKEGKEVFVHASDIQLLDNRPVLQILDWQPNIVLVSGPPIYLEHITEAKREKAWRNAIQLAEQVDTLIIDHHLLRCEEGFRFLDKLSSKTGNKIICAADFMGYRRRPLEAQRKSLYQEMPVPSDWHKNYACGKVKAEDFLTSKGNMTMKNDLNVSKRVSEMPKSAIHEMTRLSQQIEDVAFLSWAKPTSGTPEHINEAAISAIKNGKVGGYSASDGILELREEIVKKLIRDNNIDADVSQILITVGAIEGLAAAVMAMIDPGDEVILPTPTYSTHIRQVILASGKPVLVPLKEQEGFALDIEAVEAAITPKTKAVMYCSPSNPTGTVFSEEQLRRLASVALENELMVITDEAYEYFVFDDNKHFSIASIPEMKGNVVSCYTFTKTYAMTGWRIGYLHSHERLIPQIKKAHIPFAICAPVVSQYAALEALKGGQQCVKDFRDHYFKTRNLMCERLDRLNSVFEYQKPGGSYLMFPRILLPEGSDSTAFCKKLLKEGKVSATPGIAFGPTGESHLRLSFCVSEEMINKAFDRMEDYYL